MTGTLANKIAAAALSVLLGSAPSASAQDHIGARQWHLDFLHIDEAHRISTGAGVTVGVIDTGVDGGHPDLAGRLLPGADFSVENLPDALTDRDGHGTAMAGLIAANGHALGIAPDATILPVRKSTFGTTILGAAEAIDWAVNHGATVLCLAFAGPQPDRHLEAAIARAIANDVVVVAGVGNAPDPPGYPVQYPGVVGAAGIDRMGEHADVSVVTPAAVLAAPAVETVSTTSRTVHPSGYAVGTGTSDATAIIAGVAALVRSAYPDLPADEVIHRMTYTAIDRGAPGRDDAYGYGIVDPVAALTADVPLLHPPTSPPPQAGSTGTGDGRLVIIAIAVLAAGLILAITVAALAIARRRR